jgi:hypothetical protein
MRFYNNQHKYYCGIDLQRWSGFLGQETGFYKWEFALGS